MKSATKERDLGITTTSDLKVSRLCLNAVSKANKVLGMVSRQFRDLDKASFLILYKGFIRPYLEYAIQAWSPYLKKDIAYLWKVQRRATKIIKGIGSMPYSKRLDELKFTTLEKRRLRDLIEVYKLLTCRENIDYTASPAG